MGTQDKRSLTLPHAANDQETLNLEAHIWSLERHNARRTLLYLGL